MNTNTCSAICLAYISFRCVWVNVKASLGWHWLIFELIHPRGLYLNTFVKFHLSENILNAEAGNELWQKEKETTLRWPLFQECQWPQFIRRLIPTNVMYNLDRIISYIYNSACFKTTQRLLCKSSIRWLVIMCDAKLTLLNCRSQVVIR